MEETYETYGSSKEASNSIETVLTERNQELQEQNQKNLARIKE